MKKTLSLVLVLVMVIGMMAVPARADFTDSSEIQYTEATDVMAAIGVINGFEDGSFDPAGTLTREQAAKVIAYMMLGAKNADALKATTAPFSDVAASRWSAGYIAYCVNEGIINGRDDKTFDPTGTVTGYEFAKLLLGCLGYSSKIEQYVGASWAINVAKTALDIDLFDGNDGSNYNAPLTREEAALYAFNALQATLVDYESQGTSIDLGNGVIISTGASKAKAVETNNDKKTIDNDGYVQFAEKYFTDLELDADEDDFGRPANIWTYDGKDVGTYAEEADFTYTVGTAGKAIYSDLNKPSGATYTYYVDGKPVTDITTVYAGFSITSGESDKIGGNGVLVQIYETDTKEYTITVINTYAAEISDWDDDDEETVTISTLTAPGTLDSNEFETNAFSESDADDETVVYYTAAFDGSEYVIQSVVAADSVTATPTSYTAGDKIVAGGTTYKYSKMRSIDDDAVKAAVKAEDDVAIYLDSYGYAIYVDTEASASDDYAYVIGVEQTSASFSDNYIAKLVLASGEVVVVDLDEDFTDAVGFDADDYDGVIAKYSSNKDDEYTLVAVTPKTGVDRLAVTKGSARVTVAASTTVTANNKTVFFVKDGKDYDVYIGIKNVPSITSTASAEVIVVMDGTVAAAVFVSDAKVSNTDKSNFVIVAVDVSAKSSYDSTLGDYYEYNVVNGSTIEKMIFDAALKNTGKPLAATVDTIFILSSITTDKDGVVTDVDVAGSGDDVYYGTATVKAKDALIGLAGDYYTYDDDCNVYKIDSDCKITKGTLSGISTDPNDKVAFILDDDGIVTDIVIMSVPNS